MRVRYRGRSYTVVVVANLGGMKSATDGHVVYVAESGSRENNTQRARFALSKFFYR